MSCLSIVNRQLVRTMLFSDVLVLMRGGGDLATGVAVRLVRAGFPLVITELAHPLAVRREVAFSSAVQRGRVEIEGVSAARAGTAAEAQAIAASGVAAVLVDPTGASIPLLNPQVLIDARMKKRRDDTRKDAASLVVGLGPGFAAGSNCHAVVETNRGFSLGHVYWQGEAQGNTGKPEVVMGMDFARVLRAPRAGVLVAHAEIGDLIAEGQPVATVGGESVRAPFAGALRGLIAAGTEVGQGMKIGDIDPRARSKYCFAVSDKALAVGGGVLEAVLTWLNSRCVHSAGTTTTCRPR